MATTSTTTTTMTLVKDEILDTREAENIIENLSKELIDSKYYVSLKFTFPNGEKIVKKFPSHLTVKILYAFGSYPL